MNLPTFSSDLILIKSVLSRETDARYKGRVVSAVESTEDFSQALAGESNSCIFPSGYIYRGLTVVRKAKE